MRTRLWSLALVPLVGGVGLVGPTPPAGAAPAAGQAVASGSDVYVSRAGCPYPGPGEGTVDRPYCTISAASAAAQPGQTILVQPGSYVEKVAITRSGTSDAPITFRAVNGPNGAVTVSAPASGGNAFSLNGVHDVRVEGFSVRTSGAAEPVLVDGSTRVTVDGLSVRPLSGVVGVRVTGASGDVTVSRSWFGASGAPGVTIGAGVSGAVVTGNQFRGGLTVTDAPGTAITGNTLVTGCASGITVTGSSPGVAIRNNIVQAADLSGSAPAACADPAAATAITLSAASVGQSVADHNLIDPASGGALYAWGDTAYADLAAFRAATGQGAQDIAADPKLTPQQGAERPWIAVDRTSPAIDSADAGAVGSGPLDMLGNPRSDVPEVPNTGTGSGYRDRGAVEVSSPWTGSDTVTVSRKVGGGPFDIVTRLPWTRSWPVETAGGTFAYHLLGDRFMQLAGSPVHEQTVRRAGQACVRVYASANGFRVVPEFDLYKGGCTVVGARYNPVTPTRLLDTRSGIGTSTSVPVAPNAEVLLPVPSIGGVPAADISAVVLNVTATQPTTGGFLTVYPDGTPLPSASSVNFVANETVPNLVTIPLTNGTIRFRNSSGGTVHVLADLQGWFGATGSGFKPLNPVRVADSREGTAGPYLPDTSRQIDLSSRLPVDATAAVLNVTVTAPTAAGVLKVFPGGSLVPVASNLNFAAGQTIPNLVMVPVVNGKVNIYNQSSGTVHVIADLAGWFGSTVSGADQTYVPYGPRRVADTRDGTGLSYRPIGPVASNSSIGFAPANVQNRSYCSSSSKDCPTALIANLTVTRPTTAGVLTAYPFEEPRPTTSNLNFVAGETASNLAVVRVGVTSVALYNASSGSTDVIVDQAGYFIAAAS
ncbi:right-handed parallel beta-helix repeat-containing protein [Micromonospora sp. RHAY321]|uniref:right-handed parallel beta-helix repeat-containing protein n=1 Tax=Micromonospora sp. RHAY321 TaxID=2944807 RepID=UPI00207D39A8|nr:right-handed parallel beta-helix repeat-containing protein [Micromonospora sp. RHAY321]MCO1596806.1 right-handed parallel beta-helix repeat-containing protein [Micromonospora sp. RHAY321]